MNTFDEAKDLVTHSRVKLEEIRKAYEESLKDKAIKNTLLIEIKNFMENLRSALDYAAHALYDKYGVKSKSATVYFPYAASNTDKTLFKKNSTINRRIPGIATTRPDIANKIEGYQHFASSDNAWLPKFMFLNNNSKHQQLSPQIVIEKKELTTTIPMQEGEMKMVFNEGGGITASRFIYNDQVIEGPHTFDADNPLPFAGLKHELKKWTAFHFKANNEPVLPLLNDALIGVEKIINELSEV